MAMARAVENAGSIPFWLIFISSNSTHHRLLVILGLEILGLAILNKIISPQVHAWGELG